MDYGFQPRFSPHVIREVDGIKEEQIFQYAAKQSLGDLRDLLWSSIDNHDSLDLDQLEYCERAPNLEIRVLVAIADVDEFVHKTSYADEHAAHNGTSVYTGVKVFPLFPERLSTDLSSLREGEDRIAVVVEYFVRQDGSVRFGDVTRAFVQNKAKLVYESVGLWLEGKGPAPAPVVKIPGLEEQLKLQHEASERLHQYRMDKGALELESIEPKVIVEENKVIALTVGKKMAAHDIIENFMIAANMTMVSFLDKNHFPVIQRVLKTPDQWPRIVEVACQLKEELPDVPDAKALSDFLIKRRRADPERFPDLSLTIIKLLGPAEYMMSEASLARLGHFGLAVSDYVHSTAPNRRYVDVIIQRLVKAALFKDNTPYTKTELTTIADVCTERMKEAKKVERFMRKVAGAILMRGRLGERFEAMVTGASVKGTYARLLAFPVEGRVIKGEAGLLVGDRVTVRLVHLDPEQGFIDFEGSGSPHR